MTHKAPSLFDWNIAGPAMGDAFKKLDPRLMIKNPVMFVTMVGAALTTVGIFTAHTDRGFIAQLAIWLWFTVLFANFAEAVAEGRGKAQAKALRGTRVKTVAHRLAKNGQTDDVNANDLRKGDIVVARAGGSHSRRRRRHRRRGDRGRIGHHRRIRPRHPRKRRRSQRRHRRHPRALGRNQNPRLHQSRRRVP